ncbi:MAG TPA: class D sortase [Terriglobales bacterium]|nr:class D sortase [Terriglobales bacterium]
MRIVSRIRQLLFICGWLLIGIYLAAYIHGKVMSRVELNRFENLQAEKRVETAETLPLEARLKFDFGLWSKKRIAQYEESLTQHFDPPLAVLRVSKVHLEVPVFEGTDDLTLNRGVGHIVGTVGPGEKGNTAIAGHRDGFFRVLKDLGPGDVIELLTPGRIDRYTVDKILIVRPDNVSVLQPRATRSLTLVTCYPFYVIGSAPQRFIVQASSSDSESAQALQH